MKKLASIVTAIATTGVLALASAAPAQAQNVTLSFGQRYQVIETYCDRNPRDRDCRGFYDGRWNDDDYYNFYSSRRSSVDSIASGLFGFTFGAALGSIIANSGNNTTSNVVVSRGNYDDHVAACYARYRSYDEETDTFLGFDGVRHRCNL